MPCLKSSQLRGSYQFRDSKEIPLPLLEMVFGNVVGCYKMAINLNFRCLSENQYMAITAHQNAGTGNNKKFSSFSVKLNSLSDVN